MPREKTHALESLVDSTDAISDFAHTIHRLDRRTHRTTLRRAEVELLPSLVGEVLDFIIDHPGCRIQDAADSLVIKPSNASSYVSTLSGQGLVTKYPDETDRRQVRVCASKTAAANARRVDETWVSIYRSALTELAPDDLAAIQDALPALKRLGDIVAAQIIAQER